MLVGGSRRSSPEDRASGGGRRNDQAAQGRLNESASRGNVGNSPPPRRLAHGSTDARNWYSRPGNVYQSVISYMLPALTRVVSRVSDVDANSAQISRCVPSRIDTSTT